jgi:hypothetical protein
MVNLASSTRPDLLGHISLYELPSGNYYYVYFVEKRFYAAKEICYKSNKIIREESSDNDYHYNIDIFFNEKDRRLGWNKSIIGTHYSD